MHLRLRAITSVKNKLPLIIISHSARALAQSASRAGWDVITVDGFADVDTLKATVSSWCIPLSGGTFLKQTLVACLNHLTQRYKHAYVLLGAGAESLTEWVENCTEWNLCGNNRNVVNTICDPQCFFSALSTLEISHPCVSFDHNPKNGDHNWLYKVVDSCGGVGVLRRSSNEPTADLGYWQHELEGEPISALYITDGTRIECLGINRMNTYAISKEYPYVYSGAEINIKVDDEILYKISSYASNIISHFNIRGVFSLDMILKDGDSSDLYVLEVNPRISATYELYEQINPGLNLVDEHIRVCEGERLSEIALKKTRASYRIVYARDHHIVGEDIDWPDWSRDIPEAGRQILPDDPVCSVFASEIEGDMSSLLQQREEIILSNIN